jgi:hypothetical protein
MVYIALSPTQIIGDPTAIGWLTVIAYWVAAYLCFRCMFASRFPRWLWRGLAVALLGLGFNKQLDLQSDFLHLGKEVVVAQGWYHARHIIQLEFVFALGVAGLLFLLWLKQTLGRDWRKFSLSLLGLSFLVSFIFLRASVFNRIEILPRSLTFFQLYQLFELVGIACITLSAWNHLTEK